MKLMAVAILGCLIAPRASLSLAYTALSDDGLRSIPSGADVFDIRHGALLAPLLKPRVPGTPGSEAARHHLVQHFTHLPGWTLEWHNTTAKTPVTGNEQVPFANLILRRDPPWAAPGDVARLTLVAHYDSLHKPEGFIGATDSAASCAILMHVAASVDAALTAKWSAMGGDGLDEEKGLQILFLDGEEAWETWSATDSLYGSRALAETWETTPHPANSAFSNALEAISLLVLLDLLGAPQPRVPSFFAATHWAYKHLASVETRMRALGLLETSGPPFLSDAGSHAAERGYVEDDHIPFMQRGVKILHLIPLPFPSFWHTMDDDGEHLDGPTVRDWARLLTAFVAEWMDLDGLVVPAVPERPSRGPGRVEL